MAGTGSNDTRHSIELSQRAQEAGVDSLLLVVPYYNKPPQRALYEHFKAIAQSVDLPCMIYNIPGRTGINLLPETLAKLSEVPGIVAVKESSGNLDQVSDICGAVADGFAVYSGDDSLTLPILSVGGVGVVSVASHLVGLQIKQMIEDFQAGKSRKRRQCIIVWCLCLRPFCDDQSYPREMGDEPNWHRLWADSSSAYGAYCI